MVLNRRTYTHTSTHSPQKHTYTPLSTACGRVCRDPRPAVSCLPTLVSNGVGGEGETVTCSRHRSGGLFSDLVTTAGVLIVPLGWPVVGLAAQHRPGGGTAQDLRTGGETQLPSDAGRDTDCVVIGLRGTMTWHGASHVIIGSVVRVVCAQLACFVLFKVKTCSLGNAHAHPSYDGK